MEYLSQNGATEKHRKCVLLSMHPVDRCRYFDSLSASILAGNNGTVCFSGFPSDLVPVDFEGVFAVVAAVSEKYMTWNNSGFVSETLAAVERGIPILPILLEDGIENLFNTRCGKFHFLRAPDGRLTEPLLARVNAHLSALSESAVKIAAEGEIFISYRKQDAAELERLVRVLKAWPEGKTVSLWYDKSLNPGENYQKIIFDRLRGCALFLLLVTPHLLEEGNYVMRVEYPLALREKKRILPVMMRKTDLARLQCLFPGLPKCVTDSQPGAVFAALEK